MPGTCSSLNRSTVELPGSHLRTSVTKLFRGYSLAGNLGTIQQPQEQCYPFLSVCSIFVCSNSVSGNWYDCQCLGFSMCAQMLMHAIAHGHGGCMDTIRESALEIDYWREIPCHTMDSNPHQYCFWLFSIPAEHLYYGCKRKSMSYDLVVVVVNSIHVISGICLSELKVYFIVYIQLKKIILKMYWRQVG